jgi:hypothetical protein
VEVVGSPTTTVVRSYQIAIFRPRLKLERSLSVRTVIDES